MENINWYPGHMTGAKRKMTEDLKLVDCVIEIIDARVPLSGKNPDIDSLAGGKKRVIVLNKADLADQSMTRKWIDYYNEQGFRTVTMDARVRKDALRVSAAVREACREKIERDRSRGIMNRPIKAMVAGIPNVGKSTFINSFVGKASAKTGNKPGVTKGNQWIRISNDINLLDTPGILWPKFEDQSVGLKLAFIGSINDDILNITEISYELINFMQNNYCNVLQERYKIERSDLYNTLSLIAENRKLIKKGGELDTDRAARLLIDELRSGKLGRVTFDIR